MRVFFTSIGSFKLLGYQTVYLTERRIPCTVKILTKQRVHGHFWKYQARIVG